MTTYDVDWELWYGHIACGKEDLVARTDMYLDPEGQ
ncbi:hypothetical protein L345_02681, partial [Ophiophagus hannah]